MAMALKSTEDTLVVVDSIIFPMKLLNGAYMHLQRICNASAMLDLCRYQQIRPSIGQPSLSQVFERGSICVEMRWC